ncbi:MAG: PilZ domain-containing protein [Bdellovibrionota bacterium]|nr:PilZ domain-containing protein [Bdellovibrionota bacterium]
MSKVINFEEKRSGNIEKKRRKFERIMFKNILGAYAVVNESEDLFQVSLIDISRDGIQLETPIVKGQKGHFEKGEEVNLRIYFTSNSFLPILIEIKYGQERIEEGRSFMRYGASFDKELSSFKALESFIDFLYKFAEHSLVDEGGHKVNSL